MIMNSANNKEVDILRMLTKAKDEYTKVRHAPTFIMKHKRFDFWFFGVLNSSTQSESVGSVLSHFVWKWLVKKF